MTTKITEGVRDAAPFVKGEKSKGRSTTVHVSPGHIVSELESFRGEPLEGSGHEDDEPTRPTRRRRKPGDRH